MKRTTRCTCRAANAAEIQAQVLANAIVTDETDGYVKEWNINGETVTLGVKR